MNLYLTDGSEESFYTAAFTACTDGDCVVTSAREVQLAAGAVLIEVRADKERCTRVKRFLRRYDARALGEIALLLRRGCAAKEMTALGYLRLIVRERAPVRDRLSHPAVLEAMSEIKKVTQEAHRYKGFLRFMECANGIYYAPLEPDNDILGLIVPHFARRFADQPFAIHDVARQKAVLCRGGRRAFIRTEEKVDIPLSDGELTLQALWREYYAAVNIAQRPHEKQMKGYMPVRYWKYLPEKQGGAPSRR